MEHIPPLHNMSTLSSIIMTCPLSIVICPPVILQPWWNNQHSCHCWVQWSLVGFVSCHLTTGLVGTQVAVWVFCNSTGQSTPQALVVFWSFQLEPDEFIKEGCWVPLICSEGLSHLHTHICLLLGSLAPVWGGEGLMGLDGGIYMWWLIMEE